MEEDDQEEEKGEDEKREDEKEEKQDDNPKANREKQEKSNGTAAASDKDDSTSDPDLDDGMDSADEDDTAYLRVSNQTDEDDDEYESAQMDDSDSCDEYVSFWSITTRSQSPTVRPCRPDQGRDRLTVLARIASLLPKRRGSRNRLISQIFIFSIFKYYATHVFILLSSCILHSILWYVDVHYFLNIRGLVLLFYVRSTPLLDKCLHTFHFTWCSKNIVYFHKCLP